MAAARNMEVFEAYFRRADLDQDGRINGNEAVVFFQGSNLPKPILAQIWMHADRNRTGFLNREEFYNALRLATVAQSGRELTEDIVKAALFGPAALKIPPPQINQVAGSFTEGLGSRGPPLPPNSGTNTQNLSPPNSNFARPFQTTAGLLPLSIQRPAIGHVSSSNTSNITTDWLGARSFGVPSGQPTSLLPVRNVFAPSSVSDGFGLTSPGGTQFVSPTSQTPIIPPLAPRPHDSGKDSKPALEFTFDAYPRGGNISAGLSHTTQDARSAPSHSSGSVFSSPVVSVGDNSLHGSKQSVSASFSDVMAPRSNNHLHQPSLGVGSNHLGSLQRSSVPYQTNVSSGAAGAESSKSQVSWPNMTSQNILKYTKVFMEVDVDRDGKISGPQARNLFMSWKLPREVLKQVWDLSDQDSDSMLSLREFCIALYLMERYREGHSLPEVLPDSIKNDQMLPHDSQLVRVGPQNLSVHGSGAWRSSPVPQGTYAARPPLAPSSGAKFPVSGMVPVPTDNSSRRMQNKSRVPVLERHLVNQLSSEEQSSLSSKLQEAVEADKKVEELEKEILDSVEKIEFYRSKMQELVLYKSRCDNRLNEITEKSLAHKQEVESLSKKYEEKYKQAGDIVSKLTVEEATFRDIQERKMELYQAIQKMEQGGSADGLLQVRADRIQSDLEQLAKALNERCKKYGLNVRPTSLLELPFGWQPGIQEAAADWDEDWDKFEDAGFVVVKDLTADVPNTLAPPKLKSNLVRHEKALQDKHLASSSISKGMLDKPAAGEHVFINGSADAPTEDSSAQSPVESPTVRSTLGSPSEDTSMTHIGKGSTANGSPHGKEILSDHRATESTFYVDGEEHSWGPMFDANDDAESVWGIGSKEQDIDRTESFFGFGDFGLDPIRTAGSPTTDGAVQKKSPFFADSLPGTPIFSSGSSPKYSRGYEAPSFDNFSRFDSFGSNDGGGLFGRKEPFTRYDSIRSTRDSTGFTRFDSMRSTSDSVGFASFDDSDPFSSTGPFKSMDNQTPRRGSDHWSTF